MNEVNCNDCDKLYRGEIYKNLVICEVDGASLEYEIVEKMDMKNKMERDIIKVKTSFNCYKLQALRKQGKSPHFEFQI